VRDPQDRESFFRYLPVSDLLKAWGIYATSVGFSRVPPQTEYPPARHPVGHHFTWARGRVLSSTSFVYITRGRGVLESAAGGRQDVREGDLFVLFPEVWHRYRPNRETGWDEHWVEFSGPCVPRFIDRKEFQPTKPVLSLGLDDRLLELFQEAISCVRDERYGAEYILAARVVQLIAQVFTAVGRRRFEAEDVQPLVTAAKCVLLDHLADDVDLKCLAGQLGASYSWFRRTFKEYTGFSPRQFQLHHRLHRAAHMLAAETTPIGEIASRVGFSSNHYFSELFKRRMGVSPQVYRNNQRARHQ
jgi:AraC-like DNA-binding protein